MQKKEESVDSFKSNIERTYSKDSKNNYKYSPKSFGRELTRTYSSDSQNSPKLSPQHGRPHSSIKIWAKKNKLSEDEMITEFNDNKFSWLNEKYKRVNILEIINKLVRYRRVNVLKYVIEYILENEHDMIHKIISSDPPLSDMIWFKEDDYDINEPSEDVYNKIISIFNILMNFGYVFMGIKKFDVKNEIFVDSLMLEKNCINKVVREKLYQYFTIEWYDKKKFCDSMTIITNKVALPTVNIFKEKALFLISKNTEQVTFALFEEIMTYKVTATNNVKVIMDMILSDSSQSCFDKYFETVNFDELRKNICDIIIDNYRKWVEIIITKFTEKGVYNDETSSSPEELYKTNIHNSYCIFSYVMSIFYNKNIQKNDIIKHFYSDFNFNDKRVIKIYEEFFKYIDETKQWDINSLSLNNSCCNLLIYVIGKYYSRANKLDIEMLFYNIFDINKKTANIGEIVNNFIKKYVEKKVIPTENIIVTHNNETNLNKSCISDEFNESDEIEIKYCNKFTNYYKSIINPTIDKIKNNPKIITEYLEEIKLDILDDEITEKYKKQIIYGLFMSLEDVTLTDCIKIKFLISYIDEYVIHDFIDNLNNLFVNNDEKMNDIFDMSDSPISKQIINNIKETTYNYVKIK